MSSFDRLMSRGFTGEDVEVSSERLHDVRGEFKPKETGPVIGNDIPTPKGDLILPDLPDIKDNKRREDDYHMYGYEQTTMMKQDVPKEDVKHYVELSLGDWDLPQVKMDPAWTKDRWGAMYDVASVREDTFEQCRDKAVAYLQYKEKYVFPGAVFPGSDGKLSPEQVAETLHEFHMENDADGGKSWQEHMPYHPLSRELLERTTGAEYTNMDNKSFSQYDSKINESREPKNNESILNRDGVRKNLGRDNRLDGLSERFSFDTANKDKGDFEP